MPVFKVQGPNGQIIKVDARDEATAIRGAKEHVSSMPARPAPEGELKRPTAGIPIVGDFIQSGIEAVGNIGDTLKATKPTRTPGLRGAVENLVNDVTAGPRLTMAALGLAAPFTEAITRPLARAMPGSSVENNRILNTALMGAKAGPRMMAPKAGIRPPPRAAAPARAAEQGAAYVERVVGSAKATPETLTAAAGPKPRTAAEALGKSGQVAVGALARRQGMTGDALATKVSERQLSRGDRMQQDFADAVGVSPEAAAGDLQGMVDKGRAAAAPLYEKAYAAGPIDSPHLMLLVERPSMRMAMSRAMRIAAEEGRDPAELGFRVAQRASEGAMTPRVKTERGPMGEPVEVTSYERAPGDLSDIHVQVDKPTAQTWDYVKRGIDDVLNSYRDKTTGRLNLDEEGRAVLGTSRALRDELVNANPAYGEALGVSGDYLSAERAFKDGAKFVFNNQMTERQVSDHLARLSPSEVEAFKGGVANKIFDLSQNSKLDPKVLKTPRVQAKLRLALGDEAADRLIASAMDEGELLAFERRYSPAANSITADMQEAIAMQDEGGAFSQMATDAMKNARQGPIGMLTGALSGQIKNLGATARTPGMSVAARDEAGKLLMLPPEVLAEILRARQASKPPPVTAPRVGSLTAGLPLPPPRPTGR